MVRELNRWYYRLRGDPGGVDFFAEDWDNLLILDACRYDSFAERHDLPGTLEARYSRASATSELLYDYFDGERLLDTVYVTANPQLYRRRDEIDVQFHDVVHVWKDEGWDEAFKTVRPETVADAAERALERHPDKRLLVHFIQPHFPFIGETGRRHLDLDALDFGDGVINGEMGVSGDVVRRAYEENLDLVLPSVERLLYSLGGRSVVTADHGELLGERAFPIPMREYGHPAGIRAEALNKVPWHVYQQGPRRDVVAEPPDATARGNAANGERGPGDPQSTGAEPSAAVVEERLRDLGYR